MFIPQTHYVVDNQGQKFHVLVGIDAWEKLTQTIQDIQNQLIRQNKQLEDAHLTNTNLQQAQNKSVAQNAVLSKQLQDASSVNAALQQLHNQSVAQNAHLAKQLQDAQIAISKTQKEKEYLQQIQSQLVTANEALTKQLSDEQVKIAELETTYDDLQQFQNLLIEENNQLSTQLQEAQTAKSELQKIHNQSVDENKQLWEQLQELQSTQDDLQITHHQSVEENNQLQQQLQQVDLVQVELQKVYNQYVKENKTLWQRLEVDHIAYDGLQKKHHELAKTNESLTQQLDDATASIQNLENKNHNLQETQNQFITSYELFANKFKTVKIEKEQVINESVSQNKQSSKQAHDPQSIIADLQRMQDKLVLQNQQLEKQLQEAKVANKDLQNVKNQLVTKVETLSDELKIVQNELEDVKQKSRKQSQLTPVPLQTPTLSLQQTIIDKTLKINLLQPDTIKPISNEEKIEHSERESLSTNEQEGMQVDVAEREAMNRIQAAESMTTLDLNDLKLRRIPEAIKNLKQLTELYLYGNQISDLSPLQDLKQLRLLNLSLNQISDVSTLQGLKQLKTLYLQANRIKNFNLDLARLPKLTTLRLYNNPIPEALSGTWNYNYIELLRESQQPNMHAKSIIQTPIVVPVIEKQIIITRPSINSKLNLEPEMILVEGGTFKMGGSQYEKPIRAVTLEDYEIGKYPITQLQWQTIMGSNPSRFKGDNLPIENVSWNEVQDFIHRINVKTGKNYQLPTEEQWEFAARGGNKSKGYLYSGSNNASDVAWHNDNSDSKTHPIGKKKANELGIYDMSGNVCEWCLDIYGSYDKNLIKKPKVTDVTRHVLRGGSWYSVTEYCRVFERDNYQPAFRCDYLGFRLALSRK